MSARLLLVDDEENVLKSLRRQLFDQYDIEIANSGAEAVGILEQGAEFDVIMSDMRMPVMNGADFMKHARRIAPDSTRIILSGQSDLEDAITAINDGSIFLFLTKPCERKELVTSIESAIERRRLLLAEKQIVEETLFTTVKVFTDLLSAVHPAALSRATRIHQYTAAMLPHFAVEKGWQWELAALVQSVGLISVPSDTLSRIEADQELDDDQQAMLQHARELTEGLVSSIPRLEGVASLIATDGPDLAEDAEIGRGRQVLQVATTFDRQICAGKSVDEARRHGLDSVDGADEALRAAVAELEPVTNAMIRRVIQVSDLRPSMVLDEDLYTNTGAMLAPQGQEVTEALAMQIQNFSRGVGVREPFRVLAPK